MPSVRGGCGQGPEGEVVARCMNISCKARLQQSIEHFCSRSAMDIDGIGEQIARQLVERGYVNDIADLYQLEEQQLAGLEKDSAITAETAHAVVRTIERAKEEATWAQVLQGLAIPTVGEKTCDALAARFPTESALQAASLDDLLSADGVNKRSAAAIRDYLDDPKWANLICTLRQVGLACLAADSGGQEHGHPHAEGSSSPERTQTLEELSQRLYRFADSIGASARKAGKHRDGTNGVSEGVIRELVEQGPPQRSAGYLLLGA